MKRIILSFALGLFVFLSNAQTSFFDTLQDDYNMFSHLDVSLTGGSDGLGLDLATPLGDYLQFRTGFAIMPYFEKSLTYSVGIGEGGMISQERYNQFNDVFQQVTGCQLVG